MEVVRSEPVDRVGRGPPSSDPCLHVRQGPAGASDSYARLPSDGYEAMKFDVRVTYLIDRALVPGVDMALGICCV